MCFSPSSIADPLFSGICHLILNGFFLKDCMHKLIYLKIGCQINLYGDLFINNHVHVFLLIICRPDHNLQDIRAKIFPFKGRRVKAPEVVPSIALPAKRKERSLSSLVVSAPKVSTQTGFTGKRTKTGTRKAAALRGCNFILEESIKREETYGEDNLVSSVSPSSNMIAQNESQVSGIWDIRTYVTFLFVAGLVEYLWEF